MDLEEFRRCGRCCKVLQDNGHLIHWIPKARLCESCQKEWTTLFFKMKLDKVLVAEDEKKGRHKIDKIWQEFIHFCNPSYR